MRFRPNLRDQRVEWLKTYLQQQEETEIGPGGEKMADEDQTE
jgi:hypothetical protein